MKRIYSIILLFSFLVGVFQPILPMVEYELDQGDVLELITKQGTPSADSPDMATCQKDQSDSEKSPCDSSLLNDNFYPLGVSTGLIPDVLIFLSADRFYNFFVQHILSPTFLPTSPPPRL